MTILKGTKLILLLFLLEQCCSKIYEKTCGRKKPWSCAELTNIVICPLARSSCISNDKNKNKTDSYETKNETLTRCLRHSPPQASIRQHFCTAYRRHSALKEWWWIGIWRLLTSYWHSPYQRATRSLLVKEVIKYNWVIKFKQLYVTSSNEEAGRKGHGTLFLLNKTFVKWTCLRWEDDVIFIIRR